MTRYFDASALVKEFVQEEHTAEVRALLRDGIAATARLSLVEIASALHRRSREGHLAPDARDAALARLEANADALVLVELGPEVERLARDLLGTHPLRAADAIQLASAVHLAAELGTGVPFVAYDRRLIGAARAEGME